MFLAKLQLYKQPRDWRFQLISVFTKGAAVAEPARRELVASAGSAFS